MVSLRSPCKLRAKPEQSISKFRVSMGWCFGLQGTCPSTGPQSPPAGHGWPHVQVPSRSSQHCLQHVSSFQSQTWNALPSQPGRPPLPIYTLCYSHLLPARPYTSTLCRWAVPRSPSFLLKPPPHDVLLPVYRAASNGAWTKHVFNEFIMNQQ